MTDVEIEYAAATSAAEKLRAGGDGVAMELAQIQGESTGVENPAGRVALRLDLHNRLTELRTQTALRTSAAIDLSYQLVSLREKFGSLDEDLASGGGS